MPDDEAVTVAEDRSLFASLKGITRTFLGLSVFVLALLSFPSVLPWMVAAWLALHTWLAARERPSFLPLAACLAILVVKLVPRTPAMLVFGGLLLAIVIIRYRGKDLEPHRRLDWRVAAAVLWIAWGWMAYEWRSIESCGRPGALAVARPVVCLGDSLTQGLLPDRGYPDQLKTMIKMPVVNLGFSGISTSQGLAQMQRVLSHHPQVVVIELGGHDFLKGNSRAATKRNLVKMISDCRHAGADVVLMEIPRGFIVDPFASLEREVAYEQDVQLISDSWLRQIVIMSPVSPPGMWMRKSQLSDDGIHSNPKGSRVIARRVADSLVAMYGTAVLDDNASIAR